MTLFSCLQETPHWIALYKPAGTGIHSEDGEPGFVVQAAEQLGCELWPVHRLDKVTSGILLLAKDKTTAAELSRQFAERKVQKWYLARSARKPSKKQGWIKGDMLKARNGCWKLARTLENPAITRFISEAAAPSGRLYLLKPQTGKTHQLRVAMKSLGAPIDGDARYGGDAAERTFLHAYALSFEDQGQMTELLCPPADEGWPALPDAWQAPAWVLG